MSAPRDPAPPERLPSPGSAPAGGPANDDVKPSQEQRYEYRVSIESAGFSIESDFPLTNLSVFENDLTFEINCEGAERATILIAPLSEQELPSLLLSDYADGPMTPGEQAPDGREFQIICGVPMGLTWDPRRAPAG